MPSQKVIGDTVLICSVGLEGSLEVHGLMGFSHLSSH